MPLIGIVDPTHDEYKANDDGRLPKWLPLDEILIWAENADPVESPWTYELIAGMLGEHQERDYISTTMISGGCPRTSVLERKEDYVESLERFYAAFRGTMIHAMLERSARPSSVEEARFFTTIEGIPFSCSPDLVTANGKMYDYKMTETPPTFGYPWKNHTRQLQYNRFVVNHAEKWVDTNGDEFDIPFNPRTLEFQHLAAVYLGPKGPKTIETMKTVPVQTPNGKTIKRKRPRIDSDDDVLADLVPRLLAMQQALDSYPEWPEGVEDIWGGPAGWACPGKPWCGLPDCLAKRFPNGLVW